MATEVRGLAKELELETNDLKQGKYIDKSTFKLFSEKSEKLEKIKKIIKLSDFSTENLIDHRTRFFSRFGMGVYIGIVFGRRRGIVQKIFLAIPLFLYHSYIHRMIILNNGIVKKALFGHDQLSQELRLLMLYYNLNEELTQVLQQKTSIYLNQRQFIP